MEDKNGKKYSEEETFQIEVSYSMALANGWKFDIEYLEDMFPSLKIHA